MYPGRTHCLLPLGGPLGMAERCCSARGPVGTLEKVIRGDVNGGEAARPAGGGPLPKGCEAEDDPGRPAGTGSASFPDMAAGALGGESSGACLTAAAAGPDGGLAERTATSCLPQPSPGPSRRARGSG